MTRKLALATTLTTLGVIAVGGLVRATGSGDGCPDWPRCFGRWIPPLQYHALIEYSHRTIGAVAIALLLLTTAVVVARHRSERRVLIPALIAAPSILMQAVLGAIVVTVKTDPDLRRFESSLVTFHIATAMALIGLLVLLTVNLTRPAPAEPADKGLVRWARASAASVFGLLIVGAYVRGEHAGMAFDDWPLMNGRLIPDLAGRAGLHFAHRAAAVAVGLVVIGFAIKVVRAGVKDKAVTAFAHAAAGLFVTQVVVGGLQVLTRLHPAPVVAHVALSALIWAALVAAAALARRPAGPAREDASTRIGRPEPAPVSGAQVDSPPIALARPRVAQIVKTYVQLTKPRIIVLLLITTVPAMMLAERGIPSPWLVLATLFGGTLAAGAANTINMYVDRDIDAVMRRTRSRPLPAHRVEPARALAFGVVLAAVSLAFMIAAVNLAAALLAQAAILFYVFVYTIGLKRSTPQNIVIGGAAGAVPVLVGWAAVTGGVGWPAVILFAIVFFWTPPHFWALALRHAEDYAAAGVPMLPVVAGPERTRRQIAGYTVITIATSLALVPVAPMGMIYLAAAIGLGAWFLAYVATLWRAGTVAASLVVFRASILYLALLFLAVAVDATAYIAP